jgi:hypothetical protein
LPATRFAAPTFMFAESMLGTAFFCRRRLQPARGWHRTMPFTLERRFALAIDL